MASQRFSIFVATALLVGVGCSSADSESRDVGSNGVQQDPLAGGTVGQAVQNSCETSSVRGLSVQIIAEGNCLKPGAYTVVPKAGKVTFGSNVFANMQKPGRDQLVAALNANPSKAMGINSMLRTVAQQYLLYSWYQAGRCGIGLAATPGNSNHETGLAFDTSQYDAWKSILKARGFRWLGSSDPVHFDYVGSGAKDYKGLDVQAFQRLWNRNNPGDKIDEDGLWGPNTSARMKKSPADGFAKGATCAAAADESEMAALDERDTGGAVTGGHGILFDDGQLHDDHGHEVLAGWLSAPNDVQPAKSATACDACIESICAVDAACCDDLAWNATCAAHAESRCKETCF
ncbi:M15 family metallopeptidase [Pendulispora rubella]|uniref:M15 family metallopeptidase n=1 Tax=Pendulispora rubella TaxID=2741070 RepID=A0ABZ2LAS7_9BACT